MKVKFREFLVICTYFLKHILKRGVEYCNAHNSNTKKFNLKVFSFFANIKNFSPLLVTEIFSPTSWFNRLTAYIIASLQESK